MTHSARSIIAIVVMGIVLPATGLGQAITSDDFNRYNLNTQRWTFVDPVGDASVTLLNTGNQDAALAITVPAGTMHQPYPSTNTAARVMQTVSNGDFAIQVKFLSAASQAYQIQGILIEGSQGDGIRVDVSSNGASTTLYAFSTTDAFGSTDSLTARVAANLGANSIAPLQIKVQRSGDTWTVSDSLPGTGWTARPSFTFAMTVTSMGMFAGNASLVPGGAPAFTALVDFFMNLYTPIIDDSATVVTDGIAPYLYARSAVPSQNSIQVNWKTDEKATGRIEFGTTTGYGSSISHTDRLTLHSLTIPGLNIETQYYYRIISQDSTGNTTTTADFSATTLSPPNPIFSIWNGLTQTFGRIGVTQRCINILGNVRDAHGMDSLYYRLNGGAKTILTRGPDTRRLQKTGDFNIDIPYDQLTNAPATNAIVVTAKDVIGETTVTTITVKDSSGTVQPLPYTVAWATPTSPYDSAQVVDGKWTVSGGTVTPTERGYDRCIAVGDTTLGDYEVTVPVTVSGIDSSSGVFGSTSAGPSVGFFVRWKGHTDAPLSGWQPKSGYLPLGAIGWFHWTSVSASRWELMGNNLSMKSTSVTPTLLFNTTYYLKVQVHTIPSQGGFYRMKVWKSGDPEPTTWLLNGQETLSDPQTGSIVLVAHHATASFGPVTIAQVPPDLTPPAISNVQTVLGSTAAYITWNTDEPATHKIYYGLTSTYSDSVVGKEAISTTHALALRGLIAGAIYHYKIAATDDAGNTVSTTDWTFTTNSPPIPTTLATDEFNASILNTTVWTFINPTPPGNAQQTIVGDTAVAIRADAGTAHDLYPTSGYNAPRLMQNANNTDFDIRVKFVSTITTPYQAQGIIIEQDNLNLMRYDFVASTSGTRVFAATTNDGFTTPTGTTTRINRTVGAFGAGPLILRLQKDASIWMGFSSVNGGATWDTLPLFIYPMNMSKVGLFVGNSAYLGVTPEHRAIIDYFRAANSQAQICPNVYVNSFWNLLSIPSAPADSAMTTLFPEAVSHAFGFSDKYDEATYLTAGKGYWAKFTAADTFTICGRQISSRVIPVRSGWNIIGPYDASIATSAITSSPAGIVASQYFGYNGAYAGFTTLTPGMGYWVKVSQNGTLNLSGGTAKTDVQIAGSQQNWAVIEVADAAGRHGNLYLSGQDQMPQFVELPPKPPAGILDVRYAGDHYVEAIGGRHEMQISSATYPLVIRATNLNGISLSIVDGQGGEELSSPLAEGKSVTIVRDPGTLYLIDDSRLPQEFALSQNYPNPFNPSTTVEIALPKDTHVTLEVFDVVGKKVATLVDEMRPAGYHVQSISGQHMASGIYFYRLTTPEITMLKKMVLIK
jgi:hypothetical protein